LPFRKLLASFSIDGSTVMLTVLAAALAKPVEMIELQPRTLRERGRGYGDQAHTGVALDRVQTDPAGLN
jgi:hypothetical protein